MKINFHLDKKRNPLHEGGVKVVYGKAKRSGYKFRWYLILAIVISPLIFMAYYLFRTQVLITAPAIITSHPLTITATESGIVDPISVNVGSSVTKNQSLLHLTDQVLNQDIEFIQGELIKLSESLAQSPNSEEIYKRAIARTESDVRKIENIQSTYDAFRSEGRVSEVDYAAVVNINSTVNNQLSSQRIAYAEAQRRHQELLLAGSIAQAHRALLKELVVKRVQQESLTITAPFNGRIIDIHVLEGQRISQQEPLITIAKNEIPKITAYLNPKYVEYGKLDTPAEVIFPDGKTYSASVYSPVEVVNKLPPELQKPFEGQPAYLKVSLSFDETIEMERWIEGVEVEVRF